MQTKGNSMQCYSIKGGAKMTKDVYTHANIHQSGSANEYPSSLLIAHESVAIESGWGGGGLG